MRSLTLLAVVGLAVALVGVPALAQQRSSFAVAVKNSTGQTVSTLSITFRGTGGSLAIDATTVRVNPDPNDCQLKSATAQGNTAVIEFTANCVAPNAVVSFVVSVEAAGIEFGGGNWSTTPPGPQPLAVNANDVTIRRLPTLTEWGLIALGVLLAGGMGFMLYRRRPALRPAAP